MNIKDKNGTNSVKREVKFLVSITFGMKNNKLYRMNKTPGTNNEPKYIMKKENRYQWNCRLISSLIILSCSFSLSLIPVSIIYPHSFKYIYKNVISSKEWLSNYIYPYSKLFILFDFTWCPIFIYVDITKLKSYKISIFCIIHKSTI